MKLTINTQISKDYIDDEIEITIKAHKISNTIESIVDKIKQINNNEIKTIIGRKDNTITILNTDDIIRFYSENQNNYCDTIDNTYKIKKKLYELEQNLDNTQYIRISNSCIANIKYIKYFDLSIIGDITVIFKNNIKERVSKRRISNIYHFLKSKEGFK